MLNEANDGIIASYRVAIA